MVVAVVPGFEVAATEEELLRTLFFVVLLVFAVAT